jgi:hypothetical protein
MRMWLRCAFFVAGVAGCRDDEVRATRDAAPEARAEPDPAQQQRLGCARGGSLDAVEKDGTCIVDAPQPRDELNWNRVRTALESDAPTAAPGAAVPLRVTIANTDTKAPLAIVLEAEPSGAGPKRDTSLIIGYPAEGGAPTLAFPTPLRTFDAREYDVDRIPFVVPPVPPPRTFFRVTLPPRGSLTKTIVWVAYGIPPPAPPFVDDAGRRWVPKTAPAPLTPGVYTVRVELPLYRAPSELRTPTVRIEVKRPD